MGNRFLILARVVAAVGIAALAGCSTVSEKYDAVSGLNAHGSQWVGHDADLLIKHLGQPERQAKAPSGAAIYVYTWRSDKNVALCERNYFVSDGDVVGYLEKPIAMSCNQAVGKVN